MEKHLYLEDVQEDTVEIMITGVSCCQMVLEFYGKVAM